MERKDFLVEIGTEELPPKALRTLAEAFYTGIRNGLESSGLLGGQTGKFDWYCSPRRLTVFIEGLPASTADEVQERFGPAVQAAFDKNGKPTKAAEGFAASVGATVAKLARKATDKGERLAFTITIPGKTTVELLPGIVEEALKKLPIPKRMRWGTGEAEFIRPVHWLVMLYGKNVVDCEIFGIRSGRLSQGHRFHAPGLIEVRAPESYVATLESAYVRVNDRANTLAQWLSEQVAAKARALGGEALGADADSALLDEVAALCEWPMPVVGSIPERFMTLPEEVLIATIEHHQRYFPVRGPAVDGKPGKLLPKFITFANIESKKPDVVRQGNERVVVPRLEDAMFFWNTDRKTPLADRVPLLNSVTFQKDLGSSGDKVRRVAVLAKTIAKAIAGDATKVARAAQLAKCDLLTDMVGEFPELQGVMGRYYAQHDGEDAEVAQAIFEQYLPRFAGDELPATKTGQALAVADKLDTVCGIFSTGQTPSGSKDPFGLRRQALGVLRILVEKKLDLDLAALIGAAVEPLRGSASELPLKHGLYDFFIDRLRGLAVESGIRTDVFNAVAENRPTKPLDFMARLTAVNDFMRREEAVALAAANKRISNILRKAETPVTGEADPALFQDEAEKALGAAIAAKKKTIAPLAAKSDYAAMLNTLSELREPVDRFFDNVMVMAEDDALRMNRLCLLQQLRGLFNQTADFAQLQVDG